MARGGSGDGRQEKAQPVAAERGAVTSFVGAPTAAPEVSSTEVHVHFACEVELRVGGARDMAKYVPKVRYPR